MCSGFVVFSSSLFSLVYFNLSVPFFLSSSFGLASQSPFGHPCSHNFITTLL